MRIAICDDRPNDTNELVTYITDVCSQMNEPHLHPSALIIDTYSDPTKRGRADCFFCICPVGAHYNAYHVRNAAGILTFFVYASQFSKKRGRDTTFFHICLMKTIYGFQNVINEA